MYHPVLDPRIRAAHAGLSPASLRLVESLDRFPDLLRGVASPRERPDLFAAWTWEQLYPMQPWPALVGAERIAEIETALAGITELVQEVPTRIFDGDVERIARFFQERPERMAVVLEPGLPMPAMVSRSDLIISERGIQFLEVNLSARLGGWSLRIWQPYYRNQPALAEFFASEGIDPRYRDPSFCLFTTLIRNALDFELATNGEVNVVFLVAASEIVETSPDWVQLMRSIFNEALAAIDPELRGSIHIGAFPDSFETRREKLYLRNGKRVHALYEYGSAGVPLDAFVAAKNGRLHVYNGPRQRFGTDKRSLALLSQHAASGRFDDRERRLIESYVPWGRDLVAGPVEYRGEREDLHRLLRVGRERFVIKKGWSYEGKDVLVGSATPKDVWEHGLEEAFAAGGWMAQERVESLPYLFQHGDHGAAPHSVIWGTFLIGGEFAGGFLRMSPQGSGDGVINSARGATEGYLFEV